MALCSLSTPITLVRRALALPRRPARLTLWRAGEYEELVGNAEYHLKFYDEDWKDNSSDVKDLLRGIFRTDPAMRLTAAQIISHPVRRHLPSSHQIRSLSICERCSLSFLFFSFPAFFGQEKKNK